MLTIIGKRLLTALPTLDRRRHRHLPADPRAAGRSGGLFRRARGDARRRSSRSASSSASTSRCSSSSCRYVNDLAHGDLGNSLTTGQPVGDRDRSPPAGFGRTHAARPDRVDADRRAARHSRGDASRARGSTMPAASSRRPACRCRCSSPACCWSTSSIIMLGWSPAPLGRLDVFSSRAAARHRLLSDRQPDRRRLRDLPRRAQPADPAGADAGDLLAGADRAHDARLDAGGAGLGFRAHRARQRPRRRTR